ncbi:hypothetical protein [Bradyrhizobium cosmicum]|uniref:hypothetical protein n=1 Tax=Bradyrhizobium cosmicum TaxID=1404864 RepID=UPI0028EE0446|nr:hypothetical protein [Bradyrhizobium cosmicum]
MSHLILATNDRAESRLRQTRLANVVLGLYPRFVWRKLPSEERLLTGLERRSAKHCNPGDHWLDDVCRGSLEGFGTRDVGLFELCAKFDSIEIWVDPLPNDQLVLVWLLDLLRPYKEITTKLSLVHTDDKVANYAPESVAKWKLPAFKVTDNHLVAASRAWRAHRAETPESCFDLLMTDLAILPRLRSALVAVLEASGQRDGTRCQRNGSAGFCERQAHRPEARLRGELASRCVRRKRRERCLARTGGIFVAAGAVGRSVVRQ